MFSEDVNDAVQRHLEDTIHPDWTALIVELRQLGYGESEIQHICYSVRKGDV